MSFPCTKCGLCCQNISKIEQLKEFHSGDGVCKYYIINEGCSIYEHRPDVCRIDEGYIKFFSEIISHSDYYQKNADVCNQLQEKNNIDINFRVIL